ncbi:VOC family protein [Cryobacterium gelidum]|uniref:VOC family protein n=1 Tax=Cryobacterium gelidum TaxID=1259164 RepID=UPI001F545221|nr:VOC family protein [Cryobacterium gelidum]
MRLPKCVACGSNTASWFDGQAEQAANFYISIFPNSRMLNVARYPEGGPAPAGSAMSVSFVLDGLENQGLNAGPQFSFTEAISFFVQVETQAEIDDFWNQLTSNGGEPGNCGWLKDQFGLSWQVVPTTLGQLLGDLDPARASRVMATMMGQTNIIIADLRASADSE